MTNSNTSLFTKWNLILVVVFVLVTFLLIWFTRQQSRNPYSDAARLSGIMLSMLADSSRQQSFGPPIALTRFDQDFGGNVGYTGYKTNNPTAVKVEAVKTKRHRFSQKQRHYIASLQNYRCFICENQLADDLSDTDIDHILSLKLGGRDWPCISNLSALCTSCHRRKTILERKRAID